MQGDAAAEDGKEVLDELELRTKLLADMEDKYDDLGEKQICDGCTSSAAMLSCSCMKANKPTEGRHMSYTLGFMSAWRC